MPDLLDPCTVQLCADQGWAVVLGCRACQHQREFPVSELTERFKPGVTMQMIRERATCSACGSDDIILYHLQDNGAVTKVQREWEEERARRDRERSDWSSKHGT